jgi:putative ABC transport system substrate-binding protein
MSASERAEIGRSAPILKVLPQFIDVRTANDFAPAFEAASRERAEAVLVGIDGLTQANRHLIAELAAKHRIPTAYPAREFAEAGGLLSYGVSYPDLYRRAASYVDRIFKGEAPGDLPIEQPVKFELVINLKTARDLRFSIPPTMLTRADEVIE